jgi:hypothetical protein
MMEIAESGTALTIQVPERRARQLTTDGSKNELRRVVLQSSWKKGRLEIRTETRRLKIKETWVLAADGEELQVEVRARRQEFGGELALKRVYRKAPATAVPAAPAAPAPPDAAAPPVPPPPGAPSPVAPPASDT